MKFQYVFIDYENVRVKSLALLEGEHFRVRVFLGKGNTKIDRELAIAMQKLGDRADYIALDSSGANALDFHIAYYLGVLVSSDPTAHFFIISKDKGFDPLISYLNKQATHVTRSVSIEAMPCFASARMVPASAEIPVPPATKYKVSATRKSKVQSAVRGNAPAQDTQIEAVIENLQNRRSARPTKMKTLLTAIHAKIGKARPLAEAEAVRNELVARKYVMVDGLKVTYQLPMAD